jgi:hypothetical protein
LVFMVRNTAKSDNGIMRSCVLVLPGLAQATLVRFYRRLRRSPPGLRASKGGGFNGRRTGLVAICCRV